MHLNYGNTEYDERLEVLCMITRAPLLMPLRLIADDLGHETQQEVSAIVKHLIGRGFKLHTMIARSTENRPIELRMRGRAVFCHVDGWGKLTRHAEKYWNNVYGPESENHKAKKRNDDGSARSGTVFIP